MWNRFKIMGHDEKADTLKILDGKTRIEHDLPRRKSVDFSEDISVLRLFLFDKASVSVEVREGGTFILQGAERYEYRIESIDKDTITIKIGDKSIKLPLTTHEEIERKLGIKLKPASP